MGAGEFTVPAKRIGGTPVDPADLEEDTPIGLVKYDSRKLKVASKKKEGAEEGAEGSEGDETAPEA